MKCTASTELVNNAADPQRRHQRDTVSRCARRLAMCSCWSATTASAIISHLHRLTSHWKTRATHKIAGAEQGRDQQPGRPTPAAACSSAASWRDVFDIPPTTPAYQRRAWKPPAGEANRCRRGSSIYMAIALEHHAHLGRRDGGLEHGGRWHRF